jgi:hypothetical protein
MIDSELSQDNRVDFTVGTGMQLYRVFRAQQSVLPGAAAFEVTNLEFIGQVRESMGQTLLLDVVEPPLGDIIFELVDGADGTFSALFPALSEGQHWYSILAKLTPDTPHELWCWGSITVVDQPTEITI